MKITTRKLAVSAILLAADVLLTVFDGSEGGTAATIRYAKRRGTEIVPVWL